ncbi:MAG: hypothetical protein RL115_670 [Bacteroidota bacterium]|jgi:lactoylglutathione lyase
MNIPKKLILLLLLFGLTKNHFLLAQSRINHLAFYVVNLEQSGSFYKEVIGLDTLAEPFHDGKHAWFKMGANAQLHIISGAKVKIEHNKNTHICFSVPSLTIFIEKLKNKNIAFENWAGQRYTHTNRVDGVKQIYFKDPDGYWIEVNDAKE